MFFRCYFKCLGWTVTIFFLSCAQTWTLQRSMSLITAFTLYRYVSTQAVRLFLQPAASSWFKWSRWLCFEPQLAGACFFFFLNWKTPAGPLRSVPCSHSWLVMVEVVKNYLIKSTLVSTILKKFELTLTPQSIRTKRNKVFNELRQDEKKPIYFLCIPSKKSDFMCVPHGPLKPNFPKRNNDDYIELVQRVSQSRELPRESDGTKVRIKLKRKNWKEKIPTVKSQRKRVEEKE